jgi:hypothetical protein
MPETFRFSDFQQAVGTRVNEISFNDIAPAPERDADGNLIPIVQEPVELSGAEAVALVEPYVRVRLMEQVRAVVPLGLYLALFQLLILEQLVEDSWLIMGGLFAVMVGLMFFMEGLKLGLMPLGEMIGSGLPRRSPLPRVLFVTMLLGIGVATAAGRAGAGMMYVTPIEKLAAFVPESVIEKLKQAGRWSEPR